MTNNFTENAIENNFDLIARELKMARVGSGLALQKIATSLNIKENILKQMEAGAFDSMPTGAYSRSYLKEYAKYLGLKAEDILTLFDEEVNKKAVDNKDMFSKQVVKRWYFFAIPKIVKNILILASVFLCLSYLGLSLQKIKKPADLFVYYPPDNITISDNKINITGSVEPGAKININGEPVLTNEEGDFSTLINLKQGFNTVMIIAEKGHGVKNIIKKQILVKK